MAATNPTAGMAALGASPNAAIPAGSERTPTPTMPLTRLNTSLGIEAVPPPTAASCPPPRAAGETAEEDKRFDFLLMRPAPPLGTERATFAVATKGAFDAADATDSDAATRR